MLVLKKLGDDLSEQFVEVVQYLAEEQGTQVGAAAASACYGCAW